MKTEKKLCRQTVQTRAFNLGKVFGGCKYKVLFMCLCYLFYCYCKVTGTRKVASGPPSCNNYREKELDIVGLGEGGGEDMVKTEPE